MRLSKYMTEGRGQNLARDKAYDLIGTKCVKAWEAARDGHIIFRGVNDASGINYDNPGMFIQPRKHVRKSANTSNWYTQIISNSKLWKQYPRRDKSIICSNNRLTATGYGVAFIVFPFDNARIGVCSENDFWDSFGEFAPDRVNSSLREWASDIGIEGLEGADQDVKEVYKILDEITKFYREGGDYEIPAVFWEFKPGDDLKKFIEEQFDPKANGFRVVKAGDSLPTADRELYTDAPSVLWYMHSAEDLEIIL